MPDDVTTKELEPAQDAPDKEQSTSDAQPERPMADDEIYEMFGVDESAEDTELDSLMGTPPEAKSAPEPKEDGEDLSDSDGAADDEEETYVPRKQYMALLEERERLLSAQGTVPQMEVPEPSGVEKTSDGAPSASPAPKQESPVQPAVLSVPEIPSYQISDELAEGLNLDSDQRQAFDTILAESGRRTAVAVTQALHQGLDAHVMQRMVRMFPVLQASAHILDERPEMERYPGILHAVVADEMSKNPGLQNTPRALAKKVVERLNVEIPKGERRAKEAQKQGRQGPSRFSTRGSTASNRSGSKDKSPLSVDQEIDRFLVEEDTSELLAEL